jgi:hypothetical protein
MFNIICQAKPSLILIKNSKLFRFRTVIDKCSSSQLYSNIWKCGCEESNYICTSEYCGTCRKTRLLRKIECSNPNDPSWKKLMQQYKKMNQSLKKNT